jgi:hypothetical protein
MAIVLPALDTRNTLVVIALSRDGEICKLQPEVTLQQRHDVLQSSYFATGRHRNFIQQIFLLQV